MQGRVRGAANIARIRAKRLVVPLTHFLNEGAEEGEQKGPEVCEDLADVVLATAEHGVEASPVVPLRGHRARGPSDFMWPISGSMALRRRRSLRRRDVRPRRVPLTRTLVPCTRWPR